MLVDDLITLLEQYRGRMIYYQDEEIAFRPSKPRILDPSRGEFCANPDTIPENALIIFAS